MKILHWFSSIENEDSSIENDDFRRSCPRAVRGRGPGRPVAVSKNDEFCMKNEELCIKNEGIAD